MNVPPYVLPIQHDKNKFKEIKEKVKAKAEMEKPAKLADVKVAETVSKEEPSLIKMPVPLMQP